MASGEKIKHSDVEEETLESLQVFIYKVRLERHILEDMVSEIIVETGKMARFAADEKRARPCPLYHFS